MKKEKFEDINKYSEASGVTTLVDPNIRMKFDSFGLYRERVSDEINEISEQVKHVSPNLNNQTNESEVADELYSDIAGIKFDSRIGYYKALYVGYVQESDYRKKASSGGIGTWIFKELFEKDMIDYVIHVKKNNDENSKILFKYDVSSSVEEIREGAKTRYYPVELSEALRIVKDKPGRYAVIGIPSFIYAIRLLAQIDEVIQERIKFTVGLICGHQKSSKFAESMAWQMGIKPGDLLDIDFRHKFADRPASSYGVKVTGLVDGNIETIIQPTSELFGQNWGWGFFKPMASNFTDDVFNETADIVLGDAWLPEYTKDSKGNNIVIVRNSDISKIINDGINEGKLKLDVVDNEIIFASQEAHYRHTHDELAYRLHKKEKSGEWLPLKRVKPSDKISKHRMKIQDLREEISYQSHIKYKEAVEKNDFDHFVTEMSKLTNQYSNLYRKIRIRKIIERIFKGEIKLKDILDRIFKQ